MNNIKSIAVFTSIRSEYGPLKPILKEIRNCDDFELKLWVGGAHLKQEFGYTKEKILNDGFTIETEFDFLQSPDLPDYLTRSMGILQQQVGTRISKNPPDLLMILGDRFELIPVVSAALVMGVPIAHISGGEITEGSVDNQIRHSITKMAHIHFPATEIYRQNILKMGEEDWRICMCGEPGLDGLRDVLFYSKQELFSYLNISPGLKTICLTFHPETVGNSITGLFIKNLIENLLQKTPFQLVATASNFDYGGEEINRTLEQMAKLYPRVVFRHSLGEKRYYSLLKYSSLMLGNSSSGAWEAQSFNLPVINVGERQKGRLFNINAMHAPADTQKILNLIELAVSDSFRIKYWNQPNIYGTGKASKTILDFLKGLDKSILNLKRSTY